METHRSKFDANGYVCIENVLNEKIRANVIKLVESLKFEKKDYFIETKVKVDDDDVRPPAKQIQHLHEYDAFFRDIYDTIILPTLDRHEIPFKVERTLDEPTLLNVQLFQKHANGGSGITRPHQDDYYFQLDLERSVVIVCWIALDDVNEANGCLRYLPGSHVASPNLLPHFSNVDGAWRTRTGVEGYAGYLRDVDIDDLKPAPVRAGDMLVHHCRTIHAAGANATVDSERRALTFIVLYDT